MVTYRNPSDDLDELIEVEGEIVRETPEAYLLDTGMGKPEWVPKSKCEDLGEGCFKLPEWMARRKGLI